MQKKLKTRLAGKMKKREKIRRKKCELKIIKKYKITKNPLTIAWVKNFQKCQM